jgi:hypothetical protein
VTGYYLKPCQSDGDCRPNVQVCDAGLKACTPNPFQFLPVGDQEFDPLCIGGLGRRR